LINSIDAENKFDKTLHPFVVKKTKLGMEGKLVKNKETNIQQTPYQVDKY